MKMVQKLKDKVKDSQIEESNKTYKITESQFKTIVGDLKMKK